MTTEIPPCGEAPHNKCSYVLLQRPKKGKAWSLVAECKASQQSCLAEGESHLLKHAPLTPKQLAMVCKKDNEPWIYREFYSVFRVVGGDDWAKMQAKEHLKKAGIRAK